MKDEAFIRGKVPMTKEEIRTISLSKLHLEKSKNFLDVGAGTGSVGIQAAIDYPELQVTAIEQKDAAIDLIQQNVKKFELQNYTLLLGTAPLSLDQKFDGVFIGGSGGNLKEIIDWSQLLLKNKGSLVLNFILLENALEAIAYLEKKQWCELEAVEVNVSNLTKLGKGHYFKPQNPTIIISCKNKEEAHE